MNVFEEFMTLREVVIDKGKITMDRQRIILLPVNFLGRYSIKLAQNPEIARKLYDAMKKGMIEYSQPLGKEYALTYRDFLDRWVKYCAFGGWGLVEYELVENEKNFGYLRVRNLPLHLYLKQMGVKEPSDVIFEGLIAGSASGTFRTDIDVIEVKCVCSGDTECIYYWGSRDYLREKFPEMSEKRFGSE